MRREAWLGPAVLLFTTTRLASQTRFFLQPHAHDSLMHTARCQTVAKRVSSSHQQYRRAVVRPHPHRASRLLARADSVSVNRNAVPPCLPAGHALALHLFAPRSTLLCSACSTSTNSYWPRLVANRVRRCPSPTKYADSLSSSSSPDFGLPAIPSIVCPQHVSLLI
jgi:hypothetical protein